MTYLSKQSAIAATIKPPKAAVKAAQKKAAVLASGQKSPRFAGPAK